MRANGSIAKPARNGASCHRPARWSAAAASPRVRLRQRFARRMAACPTSRRAARDGANQRRSGRRSRSARGRFRAAGPGESAASPGRSLARDPAPRHLVTDGNPGSRVTIEAGASSSFDGRLSSGGSPDPPGAYPVSKERAETGRPGDVRESSSVSEPRVRSVPSRSGRRRVSTSSRAHAIARGTHDRARVRRRPRRP
jgi:hypothetical protein